MEEVMENNNNNSLGLIIVGVLGFIGIIIVGKWILNDKDCHNGHCEPRYRDRTEFVVPQQPMYPQRQPRNDDNLNINVQPPCPPHFHNQNEFWFGYRDGYAGRPPVDRCAEYMSGYRIGIRDRHAGCHDYFDRHCPSDFSLRVPGFRLDIK
jgi:hypothetical protein